MQPIRCGAICVHVCLILLPLTLSFQSNLYSRPCRPPICLQSSEKSSQPIEDSSNVLECATVDYAEPLKQKLIMLGASYDRGFGATPKVRQQVDAIIEELVQTKDDNKPPTILETPHSTWRMIWTTASDVLLLQASPLATVGAIHQVYNEGLVISNVIDFIPRVQSIFPGLLPSTVFRATVSTQGMKLSNNRVELQFQRVQVAAIEVLGQTLDFPAVGADLPQLPESLSSSSSSNNGYFDILFQDATMLVIRQNAPGGIFVSVRVPSLDG